MAPIDKELIDEKLLDEDEKNGLIFIIKKCLKISSPS